jgi:hypothetical protein
MPGGYNPRLRLSKVIVNVALILLALGLIAVSVD